ncbi:Ig-like domain-containing protein [Streptomyces sp. NPDC058304]|uniref:Ig-like domain-containing protein n=1 Tax=Streptomyces sp. NPDC058304 TaxID=3346437 RepID=UPI0036F06C81
MFDWWHGSSTAKDAPKPPSASAPALPPDWKLRYADDGIDTKTTTLWTDMHATTTLRLLEHESAEDARSARRDDLDDDEGLTSRDVELTILREPDHGTVTLQDGIALYTPIPAFGGLDTFDYTIKLRSKPELQKVRFTVEVGLSPGARYRAEHKYETCADAHAASAVPLRQGEDGYGRHLDGIACE